MSGSDPYHLVVTLTAVYQEIELLLSAGGPHCEIGKHLKRAIQSHIFFLCSRLNDNKHLTSKQFPQLARWFCKHPGLSSCLPEDCRRTLQTVEDEHSDDLIHLWELEKPNIPRNMGDSPTRNGIINLCIWELATSIHPSFLKFFGYNQRLLEVAVSDPRAPRELHTYSVVPILDCRELIWSMMSEISASGLSNEQRTLFARLFAVYFNIFQRLCLPKVGEIHMDNRSALLHDIKIAAFNLVFIHTLEIFCFFTKHTTASASEDLEDDFLQWAESNPSFLKFVKHLVPTFEQLLCHIQKIYEPTTWKKWLKIRFGPKHQNDKVMSMKSCAKGFRKTIPAHFPFSLWRSLEKTRACENEDDLQIGKLTNNDEVGESELHGGSFHGREDDESSYDIEESHCYDCGKGEENLEDRSEEDGQPPPVRARAGVYHRRSVATLLALIIW